MKLSDQRVCVCVCEPLGIGAPETNLRISLLILIKFSNNFLTLVSHGQ